MSAEHVHACTAVMLNTYAAICCGCGRGKWVCRFINIDTCQHKKKVDGKNRAERADAAGILSARRARRAQAMPCSISDFLTNEVVGERGLRTSTLLSSSCSQMFPRAKPPISAAITPVFTWSSL